MVKQYGQLYIDARRELLKTEEADMAGMMARHLLMHVSGKRQEEILANRELYASEEVCRAMERGIKRLSAGEPLAYVLGEWDFYGLRFYVTRDVLIPRDDTCALVSMAVQKAIFLPQNPRILDLCCGSGCIGIALASRVKDARVTLADLSPEALAVAKKNMQRHKLSGRVSCVSADALKPVPPFLGKFDMIVSNPPYITRDEMKGLDPSVVDYEPHMALYGGEDGLDFYRAIARNYANALKPGGYLAFETGDTQAEDVCRILEENGYTILERSRDFNDIQRAVLAQYGRKED